MILLGLTGGIGMGKSTCADLLRAFAVPVVDTDALARQLVEPGQPALEEIKRAFGPQFVGEDGRLRRRELGRHVFANPELRKTLEAILHPKIRALWQAQAQQWRRGGTSIAAVVIPLLFETGAEKQFDAVVCVACSATTQRARLSHRSWSTEEVDRRNRAQMPVSEKQARADYVIWTESDLDTHREQLRRVLAAVTARAGNGKKVETKK